MAACGAGALLAPVAVYLFGSTLMGPYEGDGGLAGFTGSVFAAAAGGKPGAIGLVLAPAALILTWWGVFRLLRSTPDQAPADKHNS